MKRITLIVSVYVDDDVDTREWAENLDYLHLGDDPDVQDTELVEWEED